MDTFVIYYNYYITALQSYQLLIYSFACLQTWMNNNNNNNDDNAYHNRTLISLMQLKQIHSLLLITILYRLKTLKAYQFNSK